MKRSVAIVLGIGFAVSGCEDFNRPISSTEFDPMRSPSMRTPPEAESVEGFRPGQFVTAIMDNTAFFSKKPDESAEADRLLPRGTSMKVVAASGGYSKVELDSGEVGYVPSIMLEDPNAPVGMDFEGVNPYDAYPLDGQFDTLPDLPAGGTPPSGAVPTLIDPANPESGQPAPGIDTLPNLPPAVEGAAPGDASGQPPAEGAAASEPSAEPSTSE